MLNEITNYQRACKCMYSKTLLTRILNGTEDLFALKIVPKFTKLMHSGFQRYAFHL